MAVCEVTVANFMFVILVGAALRRVAQTKVVDNVRRYPQIAAIRGAMSGCPAIVVP
jgi:hypothetical protein